MSTAQESSPNQNETNELKTDTLKPPETTSKNTTTHKPKTDEVSDGPESDPKAKNSLPADAPSQTTSINSTKKEDVKALNKDAAAADPQLQALEKPPFDGTKAIQEDSAAVAEITPADSQVQPVKSDSPPAGKSIATHGPETDEGKSLAEEPPADDEATPKELSPSSPPPEINDPEPRPAKTLKEDSTIVAEPSPKKSCWKKLKDLFRPSKGKVSKSESSTSSQDKVSKSESSTSSQDKVKDAEAKERQLLTSLIQADIDYITKRVNELGLYNEKLDATLESARQDFENLKEQGKPKDLQELRKDMVKLKLQDPSKYKHDGDEKDQLKNLTLRSKAKQGISPEVLSKMPQLHKSRVFETSIEFKDFEARYRELDDRLKLCLLCFSAFPGNIIRKRLMLQWWVTEGFASEEEADEYFTQLIQKGFIEPVYEKRSLSVGRCQMHLFYRSALVMLAERAKFLNFGAKGEPTENFSASFQSCLMGEGLISFEDLKKQRLKIEDLEKLHLLINVDEHILDFKTSWFSRMANLNFLYLGRWKVLATDHIEVEDTEFFSGLEKMSCVKFLSLQGISNIIALPKSILQMENLEILDVRACYNLETIPERIDFLKNLMHLDMSECYLLDHMPKGVSLLKELKVIKGFVVGTDDEKNKPCTLDDLEELPNLSKLCIYTDLLEFPNKQHVKALEKLKELSKLTITWGGNALRASTQDQPDSGNKMDSSTSTAENNTQAGKLPPNLIKLDLKCFPKSTTPYWLELRNLKDLLHLEKLYIRGGKFSDLGQYQDVDYCNVVLPVKKETWTVKVLRLKYLSEIKMEWRQLHELFPRLDYLEQVSCPNLTSFPCDANGVWIN
ncbi:hypothetical protein ACS0TY_031982 [Phlomoides rotata]